MNLDGLTPEQLRAEEATLLFLFPILNTIERPPLTPADEFSDEIGMSYGWEIADAWDRLEEIRAAF